MELRELKDMKIEKLCHEFDIKVKGVIQVGAATGQEVNEFLSLTPSKMILVEALPQVARILEKKVEEYSHIKVVNCAITNFNGQANYTVTSNFSSSSLLSLKLHKKIHPKVRKVDEILVECKTLDLLLKELCESASDYNLLYIDAQGAEGFILQGAKNLLKYITAIYTEVNYKEMYEGCILEPKLSKFLEDKGFMKKAASPPAGGQGEVFYIKRSKEER